jgi:hypothetical protein
MNRYRIRRMAERIALEIARNLPQDRFEQELWNLAAIIEEHLFSEMVRLDEAERRAEETEPVSEARQSGGTSKKLDSRCVTSGRSA